MAKRLSEFRAALPGKYFTHVLIAATQALNALLGGYADESTSSRAHRQQHKRRWRVARRVINGLFAWQKDHCQAAFEAEQARRQVPPVLRDMAIGIDGTRIR